MIIYMYCPLVRKSFHLVPHVLVLQPLPIGDALIVLPSHVGNLNGVAAIESTTVRINGEMILDLAIELRRHPGHDITLEADKSADSEVDQ